MARLYRVRLTHGEKFYDIEAGAGTKRMAARIAKAELRDRIGQEEANPYYPTRITFVGTY